MRRAVQISLLSGLLLTFASQGAHGNAFMTISGSTGELARYTFDPSASIYSLPETEFSAAKSWIGGDAFYDRESGYISFNFQVTNYSAASRTYNFTFAFQFPVEQDYISASSTLSGNGTRALTSFSGVPAPPAAHMVTVTAGQGGELRSFGIDVGTACASGGDFSWVCAPSAASADFAPTPLNALQATIAFTIPGLSGGTSSSGNQFGVNGGISLTAVPEPAGFLLAGAGAALLAMLRRRA